MSLVALLMAAWPVAAGGLDGRRVLFIALDGVAYDVVAQVVAEGNGERPLFEGLSRPTALISSFPSSTSVAFSGIFEVFGVEASPGYEAHFFDREKNEVRGGGPISYRRIDFAWRDFFDWRRTNLLQRGFGKLRRRAGIQELEEGLQSFLASDEETFFIYVAVTDGHSHLRGPDSVAELLLELDRMLKELRKASQEDFYVVLFSDHGNAGGIPLENVRKSVKKSLKRAHFRVRKRLTRDDDVVLPAFGLVSNLEAYTAPRSAAQVSRVIAEVPGVEVCVNRRQSGDPSWLVVSADGEALIQKRQTRLGQALWSYEARTGDPLGYRPVVERLRQQSGQPDTTWFADREWFSATEESQYPDALYRLATGFEKVQNPASVLCSLGHDYMHGSAMTVAAARMTVGRVKWTHGALHRDASLGFLMTDWPGFKQQFVRFDEALRPFADELDLDELELRLAKTARSRHTAVSAEHKGHTSTVESGGPREP